MSNKKKKTYVNVENMLPKVMYLPYFPKRCKIGRCIKPLFLHLSELQNVYFTLNETSGIPGFARDLHCALDPPAFRLMLILSNESSRFALNPCALSLLFAFLSYILSFFSFIPRSSLENRDGAV